MPDFQFNLGDLVITKVGAAEAQWNAEMGVTGAPIPFQITERWTQECPGGVQLKYSISRSGTAYQVLEQELLPLAEFDMEAHKKRTAENKPPSLADVVFRREKKPDGPRE